MDILYDVLSWGSPVGVSQVVFFSASGAGILLWGISRLPRSDK